MDEITNNVMLNIDHIKQIMADRMERFEEWYVQKRKESPNDYPIFQPETDWVDIITHWIITVDQEVQNET